VACPGAPRVGGLVRFSQGAALTRMTNRATDVLIVGAGPTGLFLALLLAKVGVRPRIVDTTDAPGTTSRALAVQARTLEFYRQVGLADEVIRRGLRLGAVNLWRAGSRVAHIELAGPGARVSPFPFGVIFPQDEHERLLIEYLEREGVCVERRTKVESIEATPAGIVARERGPDGSTATCEARYLAGCDGARSTARSAIGAGFPGGTYDHMFYVADVVASGGPMTKELHVFLDQAGFLGLFPLAGAGRARLIGTVRDDAPNGGGKELTWDDVDRQPVDRIGLKVERVNWFSTYRVHHRVAERFRRGNIFLLGDAAHVHSPVGGQGMNTGLGDAMNLAWKLGAVLGGRANEDLLGTYEPERIAFARRLVATTDRVFQAASSESRFAKIVRTNVVPRLLPRLASTHLGQRLAFAAVSQTSIQYRTSAWSEGHAGRIHGGDRLPWVAPARAGDADNFTPLTSFDWQAHVYGAPPPGLGAACEERKVPIHVFPKSAATEAASLREDAVYLVRPDGYVGGVFVGSTAVAALERYLAGHDLRGR
jgi:2-polyprenyl-6-methoxyphenol hydroxylase-like FAD-dependent oxidoreductase